MMSWREVHDLSELTTTTRAPQDDDQIVVGTPMRMCAVHHLGFDGTRAVTMMRWGFADRHAKSPLEKPKHMHARAETIDTLPTFADAFAHSRGLLFVKTFNEGEEITPTKTLQHTIIPRDDKPIAIAVIYERWTDRNEGSLYTFVMVTTPPNALIEKITDRMPAVLSPEHWAKWLGEEPATIAELKALLMPYEGDWTMEPAKKPPPPPKPATQTELF